MDIDWQSYLDIHFPNLAKVYIRPGVMTVVNRKLNCRNDQLLLNDGQTQTTFYDLFIRIIEPRIGTQRERQVAQDLLSFLDIAVTDLLALINQDPKFVIQLRNQMEGLFLLNGDKYLDKVGELLSTLYTIRRHPHYKLEGIGYPYEVEGNLIKRKGKDADIAFSNEDTGEIILVEIFNLNLDYEKIENSAGLDTLINGRIARKINEKHFDRESIKTRFKIFIQPFIWIYDIDTIITYKSFFQQLKIDNVLPILCLRQRSNNNRPVFYDCIEIEQIEG